MSIQDVETLQRLQITEETYGDQVTTGSKRGCPPKSWLKPGI